MPVRKRPVPMYYTGLEVENVRCFGGTQRLDLTDGHGRPARWTLIVGENGVGKTTLLESLAWMRLVPGSDAAPAPADEEDASGDLPPLATGELKPGLDEEADETLERLPRDGVDEPVSLTAELAFDATLAGADGEPMMAPPAETRGRSVRVAMSLTFENRKLKDVNEKPEPRLSIEAAFDGEFHEPFVVVYSANRQLGQQNMAPGDLDDPVTSRLSGVTELYDVEQILTTLDYAVARKGSTSPEAEQLARLKAVLARMMPVDDFHPDAIEIWPPDALGRGERSGVHFRTFSGLVPLSALSFGYQTTLAWATDLAWRLLQRYPGSEEPLDEPVVVLIDEIDLHLHPRWQLRITDTLSALFPRAQFVATAHSPLMVQVASGANLVLLRKCTDGVEIENDPYVLRSWRVDQILASELFQVRRARSPQTEALFARRDALVDAPARSLEEDAELDALRAQIAALPTAEDPDDQRAMELIRTAAALLRRETGAAGLGTSAPGGDDA